MTLDKQPLVIAENVFDENGFVETDNGLLVPAYIGSQLGFNVPGKYFLEQFYNELIEIGVLPLCPFMSCDEYLDISYLNDNMSVKEHIEFWKNFNENIIPSVNYDTLIPKAKFMIAILDGSHGIDDGVSSEIAYFASNYGSVFGIRSDFRLAENIAGGVNSAVSHFFSKERYNGAYFEGPEAYDNALEYIHRFTQGMLDSAMK
ncbi:MAG: hypothetical protein KAS90_00140 [Candidatus Aenigmarchaeota archaeon]|nr:hypothetical protein [Candidatus Aenigmarchaeota archaeon]